MQKTSSLIRNRITRSERRVALSKPIIVGLLAPCGVRFVSFNDLSFSFLIYSISCFYFFAHFLQRIRNEIRRKNKTKQNEKEHIAVYTYKAYIYTFSCCCTARIITI